MSMRRGKPTNRREAEVLYETLAKEILSLEKQALSLRGNIKKQAYTPSPQKNELRDLHIRINRLRHRLNKLRQRWNIPTVRLQVPFFPDSHFYTRRHYILHEFHHDD